MRWEQESGLGTDMVNGVSAGRSLSWVLDSDSGASFITAVHNLAGPQYLLGARDTMWDGTDKNPCPHRASVQQTAGNNQLGQGPTRRANGTERGGAPAGKEAWKR